MANNIGWYFPKNAGGMEEGFANQGINQFKVAPYQKLAREIIQNSYDARLKKEDGTDERVKVVFEFIKVKKSDIPEIDYVMRCIKASKDYYEKDQRLDSFYNAAKRAYENEYINVLKISEYNTTGLYGIEGKKEAWYGLIKSSGNSTKSGITGGSYGAGKHAPFVFSNFRTIFYSTYVKNEGFAFQGKSILCTHEIDGIKKNNVGFYGLLDDEDCLPIRDNQLVNEIYKREETGTDLFIIGAKLEENWNETIISSVIENFWMLILKDKLEVIVKENGQAPQSINCQNVRNYAETIGKAKKDFNAHKFLKVYFDNVSLVKGTILEENDVELMIEQLPEYPEKKILLMRDTEMKIKIQVARKRPINYIGIFKATGEEINKILRESEPQTHDDWNPDNVEDEEKKKNARKTINKISDWINDEINKLAYVGDIKEFDADGMDFLNIEEDNDDEELKQHNFDEFINKEKDEVEIAQRPTSTKNKAQTKTPVDEFGVGGANQLQGTSQRTRGNGKKGKGEGENPTGGGRRMRGIELSYLKTPYDSSSSIQKVILRANEEVQKCDIAINQFTDSDEFEALDIEYATIGGNQLTVNGNIIKDVALSTNANTVIEIKFKENVRKLMEVNAYVQEQG